MLKNVNIGLDLLGRKNNCVLVEPAAYANEFGVQLLQPGEVVQLLFKSPLQEYLFTDKSFTFIEGEMVRTCGMVFGKFGGRHTSCR